ncbi:hypothetical protein G7085_10145 [Tessaracoccus sp. HDW20]|uniref:hypothetical protein n=1 Tax=Tessaracoccus coleopterorum TaxID=2714950 RepID=UPI0018D49173|nr:hypothetical protein [Tessaracoccus coleopterorum]NHB84838.1 hypothetical protein [Tessaracoccus coleopterorum]
MEEIWEKLLQAGIVIAVAVTVRFLAVFVIRRTVEALTAKHEAEADQTRRSQARRFLDRAGGLAGSGRSSGSRRWGRCCATWST